MSLTVPVMKQLDDDAHAIVSKSCHGYLSDALQCLRDTGDPIAPLELLRAMWGAGQAKRPHQKSALNDAGLWLEKRLGREPDLTTERSSARPPAPPRTIPARWIARPTRRPPPGRSAPRICRARSRSVSPTGEML